MDLIRKVKVHPLLWIIAGLGIVTGRFREMLLLFCVIFIHELGHAITAHYFSWRIRKIELLPFGGVASVDEHGNRPFREELLVILAGPVQHLWMIAAALVANHLQLWDGYYYELFILHNFMILLFNLLPIWPLDGGKLFFLLCAWYVPFKRAYTTSLLFSLVFLAAFSFISTSLFPNHLNLWIIILFLLFCLYTEWKQRSIVFLRFLLERYKKDTNSQRNKTITVSGETRLKDVLALFYKGSDHYIIIQKEEHHPIPEKKLLRAFFKERKLLCAVQTLLR
ncbi:M50 family metallopeptidase [Pseudalkalibacillus caeni]|uniref:Stage IV sporulation protein FB n=1 Tax=Exobacillus caeni TaxID=2574798 RepID=A0A5R9F6N9_9BACL|nr:M50 family metallopeptidase [Pseudalkalibacillus caeni]TLS39247.1 stage IV sporulation protein FB [Pseudalkalibacillus caeni]